MHRISAVARIVKGQQIDIDVVTTNRGLPGVGNIPLDQQKVTGIDCLWTRGAGNSKRTGVRVYRNPYIIGSLAAVKITHRHPEIEISSRAGQYFSVVKFGIKLGTQCRKITLGIWREAYNF